MKRDWNLLAAFESLLLAGLPLDVRHGRNKGEKPGSGILVLETPDGAVWKLEITEIREPRHEPAREHFPRA